MMKIKSVFILAPILISSQVVSAQPLGISLQSSSLTLPFILLTVILFSTGVLWFKSSNSIREYGANIQKPELELPKINGSKSDDRTYNCSTCGIQLDSLKEKELHEKALH